MKIMDFDDPVDLRMYADEVPTNGELPSRGNLLARVSIGAAIAFVMGQPEAEWWRFTAEMGARTITAEEMAEIWGTPEFWAWLDAHD